MTHRLLRFLSPSPWILAAAAVAALAGQAAQAAPAGIRQPGGAAAAAVTAAVSHPRIRYFGGPVMTAPVNTIYVIFYGSFPRTGARNDTRTIVEDFFAHVGGSGQFDVNTTYDDAAGLHVVNALAFDRDTTVYDDRYALGPTLKDADIATVVHDTIVQGHLPAADDAIYFVLTSPDAATGLKQGCAWHDGSTTLVPGHAIKFASIPVYGGKQLQACSGSVQNFGEQNSPNDNLEADNALDSFMHELSEAITDPLPGSGWMTRSGAENGDLCNFNYGATFLAANGTHADAHLGGRDYLVQTIWQNTGRGHCANTY